MARLGWKFFNVNADQPDKLLSPYGKNLDWDKPKGTRPGKWMEVGPDALIMCHHGLHAYKTKSEVAFDKDEAPFRRVFRVEAGDEACDWPGEKFCSRKMRLLYEVSPVSGRKLNPEKVASIKRRFRRINRIKRLVKL
jgi:hypothetical protein